jgi:NAD(P)-dependent dehydrogenase (short-subunit alcohol dehydrogenase family)
MSRGNLASVQRAASATLARFNATDGPVNKAAIVGPTARVWELAPEDWDRVVQVNLTGVLLLPHDHPAEIGIAFFSGDRADIDDPAMALSQQGGTTPALRPTSLYDKDVGRASSRARVGAHATSVGRRAPIS